MFVMLLWLKIMWLREIVGVGISFSSLWSCDYQLQLQQCGFFSWNQNLQNSIVDGVNVADDENCDGDHLPGKLS